MTPADEFNELPALKREARHLAAKHGHTLGRFRTYDNGNGLGKQIAIYGECCALAIVNLDPMTKAIYGPAVERKCGIDTRSSSA